MLDIRGAAQRPVCHFELPGSDYLERRPADVPGPSGNVGPLDPSIKVIFESLGTNIKNTLRFKVINPTNMGYDFMWEAIEIHILHFIMQLRAVQCFQVDDMSRFLNTHLVKMILVVSKSHFSDS